MRGIAPVLPPRNVNGATSSKGVTHEEGIPGGDRRRTCDRAARGRKYSVVSGTRAGTRAAADGDCNTDAAPAARPATAVSAAAGHDDTAAAADDAASAAADVTDAAEPDPDATRTAAAAG